MSLSNLPIKGTSDWLPTEFAIRKYIFDTWRSVCTSFGYEEYLTPLLEPAELYRAKSGEDVGGVELTTLTDRAGRELAIRPEMTPSVTRLVSRIYNGASKPIRLFSIANFFRNENPQRGRNREFWQLNFDIFGSNSELSDLEILQLSLEIMLAFNPPIGSFSLRINSRKLIESILDGIPKEKLTSVFRILDKYEKLPKEEILNRLNKLELPENKSQELLDFISSTTTSDPLINSLIAKLADLGYSDWIRFSPQVLRGFDYYDGLVFEVFDNHPDNKRALFGGGRYNGLAGIFGVDPFPAVGCAPGDETTKLFLESWGLVPKEETEKYYLPLLDESLVTKSLQIAKNLRFQRNNVTLGTQVESIKKSLEFALKNNFKYLVLFGTTEALENKITLKDLESNTQSSIEIGNWLLEIGN